MLVYGKLKIARFWTELKGVINGTFKQTAMETTKNKFIFKKAKNEEMKSNTQSARKSRNLNLIFGHAHSPPR